VPEPGEISDPIEAEGALEGRAKFRCVGSACHNLLQMGKFRWVQKMSRSNALVGGHLIGHRAGAMANEMSANKSV